MIEIKMMLITFNRGSLHSSPMLCCVSKMPSTLKSAHHWFPIVVLKPRWLLEFSLCRRWRGFWPGCQPREAVVVYLSNIAQDWDEQSGKRPRHFGHRSQLSGRTLIFFHLFDFFRGAILLQNDDLCGFCKIRPIIPHPQISFALQ